MRCRPSWFRPPAAADQSQRGAAPGRGGCYTRGWPSCPRSEPAAASSSSSSSSSSSTLGAGSRSRAGAGEEEVAAQLGQQQRSNKAFGQLIKFSLSDPATWTKQLVLRAAQPGGCLRVGDARVTRWLRIFQPLCPEEGALP
ncbi:uncharacterized protein [Oryctolagus cuniculus]|uniref:uncharacterized protein isoform X5 n=1 Tax=Oryctolagus cuniculus TaxID=9986 RepID=UPI00387940EA